MQNTSPLSIGKKGLLFVSLLTFLSLTHSVQAQKKWKDYLITGSSMLMSGMIDGTIESISYHYDNGFKNRFAKINNQFWDPSVSWKNKYKNGNCQEGPKFAGSTNVLVCATDAYHLLRTTKRTLDGLTLAYYINKECTVKKTNQKRWKSVAKDFVILTAIRCVGFNLTYNLMFNPQKNYIRN